MPMKHLVLVIVLAAFSPSAFAEGTIQIVAELRLVRAVSVAIVDNVKHGCLSNPNALRAPRKIPVARLDRLESGRFDG